MEWAILVAGLLGWLAVAAHRAGNPGFWSAVRRHPELAVIWMQCGSDVWRFADRRPGEGWAGPYIITVEPYGTTKVWARINLVEKSQVEFLAQLAQMAEQDRCHAAALFHESSTAINDGSKVQVRSPIPLILALAADSGSTCRTSTESSAEVSPKASEHEERLSKPDVDLIREMTRQGRMPLGVAVGLLLTYFRAERFDPGETQDVPAACAAWIMIEEPNCSREAPGIIRLRLLQAWLEETGRPSGACGPEHDWGTSTRAAPSKVAVLDAHQVRVDTWRQQARDGEPDKTILKDLLDDFMIVVLTHFAEGGKYAPAAEHPPGKEFWDLFMDWVENDPIVGPTDQRRRWNPRGTV